MDAEYRQILKRLYFTAFQVGKKSAGIWAGKKNNWDIYFYTENKFTLKINLFKNTI